MPKNKELLFMEGGKAVHGTKIPKSYIPNILKNLEETLLNPYFDLTLNDCPLLGSTGKKEFNGDIDIGIPIDKVFDATDEEFFNHYITYLKNIFTIVEEVYPNSKLNLVFKQIHAAVPLVNELNEDTGTIAQIDLIFGNTNFLEWSLISFPNLSDYESWVRNALFVALGRTRILDNYRETKVFYTDRLAYSANTGILEILEYRLTNEPKTTGEKTLNVSFLSSDPKDVVNVLFNDSELNPQDVILVEDILKVINHEIKVGNIDANKLYYEFNKLLNENKKELPQVSSLLLNWA